MKIDSSWTLSIAKIKNGYILSSKDRDDENTSYIETEVIEETEELKAMETLLYLIKEHFGVYYSKHNLKNLVIKIEGKIEDEVA